MFYHGTQRWVLVRAHCWFNQGLTLVSTITPASLIKRSTQQRGRGRTKREYPSPSQPEVGHKWAKEQIIFQSPHQSQEAYQKRRGNPERAICSQEPSSPAMTACVKIEAACTLCKATSQISLLRSMFPPSCHSEPAPTSAPSTGYLLLLSCGWNSTELIFGSPW